MNLQKVVGSPSSIRLAMYISRHSSERLGHRLAELAANLIGWIKPTAYRVLRANLSQVLGQTSADSQTLDQVAHHVLYTTVRSHIDLYRALQWPREQLASWVDLPEATQRVVQSMWSKEQGTVLVFPHVGNFDLGGHAIASRMPEMQLLTLPDPSPGFQLANELRRQTGVNVTPLSPAALRQALQLLRRGGVVSIAGDRPVSDLDRPVPFFGRPARVPSGHVRLALQTGADVVFSYCVFSAESQRYTMHVEGPMSLIRTGNREEEMRINLEQVLGKLENIIRRWLGQWQMYAPVWPELLEA